MRTHSELLNALILAKVVLLAISISPCIAEAAVPARRTPTIVLSGRSYPQAHGTTKRTRSNDDLVIWDSASIATLPQIEQKHARSVASCSGDGAARSCGNALSFIFDNFTVRVPGTGPRISRMAATIEVPMRLLVVAPSLKFLQDIRLRVDKGPNSRITLIVDAAGNTTTVIYARGRTIHGDRLQQIVRRLVSTTCSALDKRVCARIENISLIVAIERFTDGDEASLAIDSDDIFVRKR